MNGALLMAGIIFLIIGSVLALFSPVIVYGFYDYTGLSSLTIYQNGEAISDVVYTSKLAGLELLIAGLVFIPLSRYF